MTTPDLIVPLLDRLEGLKKTLSESSYLLSEERKKFDENIQSLSTQLKDAALSVEEGEKAIEDLDKSAAAQEIENLIAKIGQVNPTSPRIEALRRFLQQLKRGEFSPDQLRNEAQKLMQG